MATLTDSEEQSKFQKVRDEAGRSLRVFEVLNNRKKLDLVMDRPDEVLPEEPKAPTKQEAEDSTKGNHEEHCYKTCL